jgi:hypothetical protein
MLTTALEGLGAVLIVAGVALVFVPAALVVAGLLFLLASYQIESDAA